MGAPNGPDGVSKCTVADNRTLEVFGSGVGTNPLVLPDGVAVRIPAGMQLLLNQHLFDTGQSDLTGLSGTKVVTLPKEQVKHVSEAILAGTVFIDVPAGATKTTIGHCTMSSDVTLIAVAPHMHQIGIHERVVAEHAEMGPRRCSSTPITTSTSNRSD